jgi:hypothetical protein
MGSFQTTSCISSLDLEIMDRVYETVWAHVEAREPFRDRQTDGELQNAVPKLVFDSAGSDKINFDMLWDRVLASMPDTWMVSTSGEPHRSPKVTRKF